MQLTALPQHGYTQPITGTGDKRIAQCWRVIVAPDARIASCGVYQAIDGTLQLRIVHEPDDIVRTAVVQHLDTARSIAARWLVAARQNGRLDS